MHADGAISLLPWACTIRLKYWPLFFLRAVTHCFGTCFMGRVYDGRSCSFQRKGRVYCSWTWMVIMGGGTMDHIFGSTLGL
jgi:hypothetical protein